MIISVTVIIVSYAIMGIFALIGAFLICFIENKENKKAHNEKKEKIQVDMKGALKFFKIINK